MVKRIAKPKPYLKGRTANATAAGFTLIELGVVVSLIAILSFLAAPSMQELLANQRVQSAATDVFTAFVRARSEALKQNVDVSVSSTSGNTNWAGGWKVSDGTTDFEKRDSSSNTTITGSAASITYRNSGRISAGTIPSVSISASGTTAVRCVKVNLSGQPYVTKATCS